MFLCVCVGGGGLFDSGHRRIFLWACRASAHGKDLVCRAI
jgi:hypothetical protein